MTVSSIVNRVAYAGNGATTAFSFPYLFLANADLVVMLVTTATGASVLQVLTTNYTLTGAENPAGGTVTMLVAPTVGMSLVIYRDPTLTQPIDLVNGDNFDVETGVERGFDRATLQIQRLADLTTRSMRLNDADVSGADPKLPVPSANTILGWDSLGLTLENKVPAAINLVTLTPFVATLIDDATAGAFIETVRNAAVAEATPAANDEVLIRDTSATTGKRMSLSDLMKVITALTAETVPDAADEVALYDASAATADKITLANLLSVVNTLTTDATPDGAADYVLTYDTSAAAARRVLLSALFNAGITPPVNDNDTSLATTAWVRRTIQSRSRHISGFKCGGLNLPQGATRYLAGVGDPANVTEGNSNIPIYQQTEAYQLDVMFSEAIPSGQNAVITVRNTGSNTALTGTLNGPIAADVVTSFTGSAIFSRKDIGEASAFDNFAVQIVTSAAFGTTNDVRCFVRTRRPGSTNIPVSNLSFSGPADATRTAPGESGSYIVGTLAIISARARVPVSETVMQTFIQRAVTAAPKVYGNVTILTGGEHFPANTTLAIAEDTLNTAIDMAVVLSDSDGANNTNLICPIFWSGQGILQNVTNYLGGYLADHTATQSAVSVPLPAGRIVNLRAFDSAAIGAGESVIFAVLAYITGAWVDTGITCTLNTANQVNADITNTYTIPDKTPVCVRAITSATSGTRYINASFELENLA